MPDTCVKLPGVPFDGQIFIDYQRIKWRWDATNEVWWRLGTADIIPLADEETSGLLAATDKVLLDSLPQVGGGFGFIVSPQLLLQAPWNPSGTIQGSITIHSDSLLVECVDRDGLTLTGSLSSNDPSDVYNDPVPGLRFSFSTEFLNGLCLEVYGSPGLAGAKGATGDAGQDGYTDSPPGEKGDSGRDVIAPHAFSGVKIVELTTVQDTAVVDLDLNQELGILSYTTSKMNVPEDDEPADELIVLPTGRILGWQADGQYRTLDDWVLAIPAGDPLDDDPDLVLLQMAPDAHEGRSIEVSRISLTDYIVEIVGYYKAILTQYETAWLAEIKEWVEERDREARSILAGLAHQLSECEWTRPLQFCLGIQADECISEEPPEPTAQPTTVTGTATTATATTATTGTGTTATTLPPTTTPVPDDFCDNGHLPKEYFCVEVHFCRWSHPDPPVSDCCHTGECAEHPCNYGVSGTCIFGQHRLERIPGFAVWQKDISCGPCFPGQQALVLTLHEDATRLWINVMIENIAGDSLVWYQKSLLKPIDCFTDLSSVTMPVKEVNDLTCGGPNAVCKVTIHNSFHFSC